MKFKLPKITLQSSVLLIFLLVGLDQVSKFYIKLNYPLSVYGQPAIVDWGFFKLLFIENKGMAWGTKINDIIPFLDEDLAKLLLTLFRLVAIGFLGFWLRSLLKKESSQLLRWALCLIFAGAIGNLIDSLFYGVLFSHSYGQVATLFPEEGYAPFFYGHVVDMLQFPLVSWTWPNWLPLIGGEEYTFFEYVFNVADSCISTGVAILLLFNKKIFG
ncbi:lipoprotein signal peptidase [Flavobacteriaceae bacterium]|jgi:signal peptidase II|nr:lipoprotein signal peptidase [Flavobacteriaceae bacterium]